MCFVARFQVDVQGAIEDWLNSDTAMWCKEKTTTIVKDVGERVVALFYATIQNLCEYIEAAADAFNSLFVIDPDSDYYRNVRDIEARLSRLEQELGIVRNQ